MDLKQLLTVGDNTTQPSSSQLWFHITNIVVLSIYTFIGIKVGLLIEEGVTNAPNLIDSFMWLTAVITGIITGNKFANVFLNLKSGNKNAVDPTPK